MVTKKRPMADLPADVLNRLCGESFFASNTFASLWRAKGGRPVVWCLEDESQVVAVLPGVEFGRGFLKRFMSMPDGCYGGVFVLPGHEEQCPVWGKALLDALVGAGYLRSYVFDFHNRLALDPRFETMELETTLVDISNPEWNPPDKKLLSQIRKAEREGIVVQAMDWQQHGDRFMKLMEMTEKRHHRKPTITRSFFQNLYQASLVDPRVHWVWCEYQGQGVCSHIYILEQGTLQGWQIYFDKAFSFLKPNQYIRFTTCRLMAKRGIRWLNLGGTPENAPGLSYYKHRWGGETVKYRGLVNRQGLGRWI